MKDKRSKNLNRQLLYLRKLFGREKADFDEEVTSHEIPIDYNNLTIGEATEQLQQQSVLIEALKSKLEDAKNQNLTSESGEILTVDNLSNQLLEAEIKLSASALQNQHVNAQNIVKTHMVAASSLAILPVPLFDIATLTGTQLNMLRTLSSHYNLDFDEQKSKAILTSLISGSLPLVTVVGLSSVSKLVPGIGSIGGGISMTVLTSATVYATGQVFISHFENGGSLDDFEAKHWKAFFVNSLEQHKTARRLKSKEAHNDESTPTDVVLRES
jgi:uncharacterized protein (DUF697 family)